MLYATITTDQTLKLRFYSKSERDLYVSEHSGARAVPAKKIKFVPGADTSITYIGKTSSGSWARI